MKRKIILNLAISLDGYIAKEDGSFDWIKGDGDHKNDSPEKFDFSKFLDDIDVIVMGRKAYEDAPPEGMKMFSDKKIYVATSKKMKSEYENVEFINDDICHKILGLRKKSGKNIWIYGGAGLADSFIKKDIIDEYIIGFIPIILGKGRLLFLDNNPTIKLHLDESTMQEGVVISKYTRREH